MGEDMKWTAADYADERGCDAPSVRVILNEVKDPAAQPPADILLDSSLRSE
jgi:hypothetical protein